MPQHWIEVPKCKAAVKNWGGNRNQNINNLICIHVHEGNIQFVGLCLCLLEVTVGDEATIKTKTDVGTCTSGLISMRFGLPAFRGNAHESLSKPKKCLNSLLFTH